MFTLKTNLFSGVGSTYQALNVIQDNNWCHAVVLIDATVENTSSYWVEIEAEFNKVCTLTIFPLLTASEPTYKYLDEVAGLIRAQDAVDVIIGIGGGSALDIAKGAAALRTNEGPALNYRGFDNVLNPSTPTICIPTTAGTGSEVTINAVFTDDDEMRKLGINGKNMGATYAVLDANWTAFCPRSVALSSGLDALVHSLESFITHKSTQVTRTLSANAFQLIYHNLPSALDDPEDSNARQSMLLGSYFAAAALFNSGSGISGALSYPIGVHFHVPHGIAGGITLPSVIRFNVEHGWHGFRPLLATIADTAGLSDEEVSVQFIEAIEDLYTRLGTPGDFREWGIGANDLSVLTELVATLQGAFDQNPVHFSALNDAPVLLSPHLK